MKFETGLALVGQTAENASALRNEHARYTGIVGGKRRASSPLIWSWSIDERRYSCAEVQMRIQENCK